RGGQFIFVFPEINMVVVFTGWNGRSRPRTVAASTCIDDAKARQDHKRRLRAGSGMKQANPRLQTPFLGPARRPTKVSRNGRRRSSEVLIRGEERHTHVLKDLSTVLQLSKPAVLPGWVGGTVQVSRIETVHHPQQGLVRQDEVQGNLGSAGSLQGP